MRAVASAAIDVAAWPACAASYSPLGDPGSELDVCKRSGRAERTTVLSETRPEAGLTLFRVLREGLRLDESLSRMTAGRNASIETASRTHVPDSASPARAMPHRLAASVPDASALARRGSSSASVRHIAPPFSIAVA